MSAHDILAEPLFVDGATVSHSFDTDILIPVPCDDVTCAAHPRLFAHWYALWRKSEAWVARLKREAKKLLDLAVGRLAASDAGTAAMASAMASRLAGGGSSGDAKPARMPKPKAPLAKWKLLLQAEDDPRYMAKITEIAKAEETTARLEGFVEALRERGKQMRAMVKLQVGGDDE